MTSATIPMEDSKFERFSEMLAERNVGFAEWVLALMDSDYEDYQLSKLADEAYEEYLSDPVTYTLEEVIRMNGDDVFLGDA